MRLTQQQTAIRAPKNTSFKQYWAERYKPLGYDLAPHIELLISRLENLKPGDALIINMPPRHSKSETVGAFIEYYLGKHPAHQSIFASYSADLANKRSRLVRNEISHGLTFPEHFEGVEMSTDSTAVKEWTLATGGGFKAAGVGGSITGFGAHLGVIDDPLKGRKQAESIKIREGVIEWFKGDFFTRLEPNAILIVIQTRWHKGDLTGWLLGNMDADEFQAFNWDVLELPAIADDNDAMGREPGEALWPSRWPVDKLHKVKGVIGEYDFASLYQQQPYLKGGSIFTDRVTRCEYPVETLGARIVIAGDLAASVKTSADNSSYTVWALWGAADRQRGKIIENISGKFDITQNTRTMKRLQATYGVPIYVENSPNAIPVIQQARLEGARVIPVKIGGDKFTSAQPYAAAWNTGRVSIPLGAPWASRFIEQHLAFKGDGSEDHDDDVDSAGMGWRIGLRGATSYGVGAEAAG